MPISSIQLFLCGDVMTGRAIDQILPYPNKPGIHEDYIQNAVDYIRLAERKNGSIPYPVAFPYIWGDALTEFERVQPDLRIINLETSITKSESWVPKGINYRMHPENLPVLTAAKIDCCTLANNHVLDYRVQGLEETLTSLARANIAHTGAGHSRVEATAPAVLNIRGKGRVLVFAFGMESSGVPSSWQATESSAGVSFIADFSDKTMDQISEGVRKAKTDRGDIAIASIHWGSNWDYEISKEEIDFVHHLIDNAAIDIVHGHSSHHPKGIEVYRGHLILYGCGDFINDYEGIGGYEEFRPDLSLMYFPVVNALNGELLALEMIAMQMKRFRSSYASSDDTRWLRDTVSRESQKFKNEFEFVENRNSGLRLLIKR